MVTIYDIAKEANVSGHSLEGLESSRGNVRDETAQKVLKIAKKESTLPIPWPGVFGPKNQSHRADYP